MSEIQRGMAGQARSLKCPAGRQAALALDSTALTLEWRRCREVPASEQASKFPMSSTGHTRTGACVFSNSQGKQTGTGSRKSWEKGQPSPYSSHQ